MSPDKEYKRPLLVPEVVQTSSMDCGPAALACLLQGLGLQVSYPRLRDACQTDVDGTSIDTMEEIALDLGVGAEQVMLPKDHLLLEGQMALPALVVLRLANGNTHFAVAWRRHGQFVQVMDPACGRRWPTTAKFLDELYEHRMPVPAAEWRDWAGSEEFLTPLRKRLNLLGFKETQVSALLAAALEDPCWTGLGRLDAGTRMVQKLVASDAVAPGEAALGLLRGMVAPETPDTPTKARIPQHFWSVSPLPGEDDMVLLSGAVLLRVPEGNTVDRPPAPISEGLKRALHEPRPRPLAALVALMRQDGVFAPSLLLLALLIGAGAVLVEAILFRGFIDLNSALTPGLQTFAAVGVVLCFVTLQLLLDYRVIGTAYQFGRHLENRFRVKFLEKLPRIGDRYFFSRPSSDTTERGHSLHLLRELPHLVVRGVQSAFQLVATAAGICFLAPEIAGWVIIMTLSIVVVPFLFQPLLVERDHRVRTHVGAMSRYYLDALIGLMPVRTHGAEGALRHEHENLVLEWSRASRSFLSIQLVSEGVQWSLCVLFAIAVVMLAVSRNDQGSHFLLLVYWVLNLPLLAGRLAHCVFEYPSLKNVTLRALEPLNAEEEPEDLIQDSDDEASTPQDLLFEEVSLFAGGQPILRGVNLHISAGEHLAIVGESGAGKSSLVGLLLGWQRPQGGRVLVAGKELKGSRLHRFRQKIAWVDPSVQLWNSSLLENLDYGSTDPMALSERLEQAQLLDILARFPQGLQGELGESGALVSGGEGQRVRFGRALGRLDASYVILDEAFRGLSRDQRSLFLKRSRAAWPGATLLFISHDIEEALAFDRVLVVRDGIITEDANPADLTADPGSEFSQLLAAEKAVREKFQEQEGWRHFVMENGCVGEVFHID